MGIALYRNGWFLWIYMVDFMENSMKKWMIVIEMDGLQSLFHGNSDLEMEDDWGSRLTQETMAGFD